MKGMHGATAPAEAGEQPVMNAHAHQQRRQQLRALEAEIRVEEEDIHKLEEDIQKLEDEIEQEDRQRVEHNIKREYLADSLKLEEVAAAARAALLMATTDISRRKRPQDNDAQPTEEERRVQEVYPAKDAHQRKAKGPQLQAERHATAGECSSPSPSSPVSFYAGGRNVVNIESPIRSRRSDTSKRNSDQTTSEQPENILTTAEVDAPPDADATMPATSDGDDAGADGSTPQIYPYNELAKRPFHLDVLKLESYLSDEEFKEVFKMDKQAFYKLARWRQEKLKKEKHLW